MATAVGLQPLAETIWRLLWARAGIAQNTNIKKWSWFHPGIRWKDHFYSGWEFFHTFIQACEFRGLNFQEPPCKKWFQIRTGWAVSSHYETIWILKRYIFCSRLYAAPVPRQLRLRTGRSHGHCLRSSRSAQIGEQQNGSHPPSGQERGGHSCV